MEEESQEKNEDCWKSADGTTSSTITSTSLTDTQRERIAHNKQKALALRRARVRAKPYDKPSGSSHGQSSVVVENQYSLEDTRGGFVLGNLELEEEAIWQERHSGPATQDDGIDMDTSLHVHQHLF